MKLIPSIFGLLTAILFVGCASGPDVKRQAYARYSTERQFEHPFATTWNGIEGAVRGWKVVERDPEEANPIELKKLTERELVTDWIFTQSRDRYHEYKVNGSPRKKYLQLRIRYRVKAKSEIGSTRVAVATEEEIELLDDAGQPRGYEPVEETDTSRAKDLLDKINLSILAAAP
jgi:hypothetical protein